MHGWKSLQVSCELGQAHNACPENNVAFCPESDLARSRVNLARKKRFKQLLPAGNALG